MLRINGKVYSYWRKKIGVIHLMGQHTTLCGIPMLGSNYSDERASESNQNKCNKCWEKVNESPAPAELTKTQRMRLKALGFEGTDVSLSISLLEYNYLYSDELEVCIIYRNKLFDWEIIEPKEVIEKLQTFPEDSGFWKYIGMGRLTYINMVNIKAFPVIRAICDIESYSVSFFESHIFNGLTYKTIDELINILENHKKSTEVSDGD